MLGKELPGRGATPRPAGKDAAAHSASGPETHDPIATLIERIRDAAERGEPLAAGTRVRVRKVRQGLYRVEQP